MTRRRSIRTFEGRSGVLSGSGSRSPVAADAQPENNKFWGFLSFGHSESCCCLGHQGLGKRRFGKTLANPFNNELFLYNSAINSHLCILSSTNFKADIRSSNSKSFKYIAIFATRSQLDHLFVFVFLHERRVKKMFSMQNVRIQNGRSRIG